MHKPGTVWITLALLFVGAPGAMLYYGTVPAFLLAVVLGLLAYAFAVLLLVGCFWRRYKYGRWPDFLSPPPGPSSPPAYQFSKDALTESCLLVRQAGEAPKEPQQIAR